MTGIDDLLDGSTTPGVHRVRRADPDALAAAGWRVGVLGAVETRGEALAGVGEALGFPGHYGRNLDALWDCLTDLEAPTALVWAGWQVLATGAPQAWADVFGVLTERVAEQPPFAIVLADDAGAGQAVS